MVNPFKKDALNDACPWLEPLTLRKGSNGQTYYTMNKKAPEEYIVQDNLNNGVIGYISDVYGYCESNLVLSQYRKLTWSGAQSVVSGEDRLDRCDVSLKVQYYCSI